MNSALDTAIPRSDCAFELGPLPVDLPVSPVFARVLVVQDARPSAILAYLKHSLVTILADSVAPFDRHPPILIDFTGHRTAAADVGWWEFDASMHQIIRFHLEPYKTGALILVTTYNPNSGEHEATRAIENSLRIRVTPNQNGG